MALSGIIYADSLPKTDIVCEDINLYKKLVSELGSNVYSKDQSTKTIQILDSKISSITELDLSGSDDSKITDITGLDKFTSLQNLNLSRNSITSIEPITSLTSITTLNLSGNQATITDVDQLSSLVNMNNLNMSSSKITSVDFMNGFNSLQTLDVSGNGISSLASISGLSSLKNLNISKNTSFSRIDDILSFSNLTQLDISETGIQTLENIYQLTKLEVLKVKYLEIDLSPIVATYKNDSNELVAYLSELKELDISYTTKSISFTNLAYLTNLTDLYMVDVIGHWKGTTSTALSLSGIYKLPKIEYINLSNNNISDLSGILYTKTVNGETVLADYLKATEIILKNNNISDLTLLSGLPQAIKVLDLSYNKISSINPLYGRNFTVLDLRYQDITWNVYKKTSVDQYIILPDIFQDSMRSGSLVYAENSNFSINYTDVVTEDIIRLNTEKVYLQPDNYNVIISKDAAASKTTDTEEQKLKIRITGNGIATGSTVTFNIGTNSSYMDSVLFKDANLCEAIKEDLIKQKIYARNAHFILNLQHNEITLVKKLELIARDIHDLTGMESFTALIDLNLSENAITTIDQLQYCTNITILNVSNNNIGDNNKAIEKMTKLEKLCLSNTEMTNISCIQTLIDYWTSKKKFTLTDLDISGNGFTNSDIESIAGITSLLRLNVSNNKLDNVDTFEPLKGKVSTFDVSHNLIQDISVLSKFTNLTALNLSNNQIQDISPVSSIGTITSLIFSGNKVKDISSLSSLTGSLTVLNMDGNKIEDVSAVDSSLIKQELSAGNQKIIKTLSKEDTGTITIELPQIFKASQNSSSKFYTSSAINVSPTDCVTLSSDGESIVIDLDTLAGGIAVAKITGGEAKGTTLAVATPIEAEITYSVSDMTQKTNQDIIATISFKNSDRDVTITNNDGKNTYKFTKNGDFTFEYTDEYGFEGTATAVVDNIDKEPPTANVSKEIVDKKVVVTITVSEQVTTPEGWTAVEGDEIKFTKTFAEDANETVNLVDEAGNSTAVDIEVEIDKTAINIATTSNTTYQKSQSTEVTVTGSTNNVLKYYWQPDNPFNISSLSMITAINNIEKGKEGTKHGTFTSGNTVSIDSYTGEYYLLIVAYDTSLGEPNAQTAHEMFACDMMNRFAQAGPFYLDNTPPTSGTLSMKLGSPTGSDYTNNAWTNQDVYLSAVNGSDADSGHKSTTFNITKDGSIYQSNKALYTLTDSGTYSIVVTTEDNAGNTVTGSIYTVKIDKTPPMIIGVKDGETYNKSVTPIVQDENLNTVTLTKNGTPVANYQPGTEIKNAGQYVLTATDKCANTTTVSFKIELSDIITSKENTKITVIEDETTIKDITPKTTVEALKQNLNAEMEYTIVDKNGYEISEKTNVGTGCKIKMENSKIYTLIVKGDCNGDGQAELKDILAINKHRLNKAKLTAEYLQAADVNVDGKVELKDILQINKFRLGKINEL